MYYEDDDTTVDRHDLDAQTKTATTRTSFKLGLPAMHELGSVMHFAVYSQNSDSGK